MHFAWSVHESYRPFYGLIFFVIFGAPLKTASTIFFKKCTFVFLRKQSYKCFNKHKWLTIHMFSLNKCKNIRTECDCYQAWVSANTPHHPHYNHFYSIPSLFLAFSVCVIGRFCVLRREVGIRSPWGLLSKLLNAYRWSHQMTLWLFCIVFLCIQMNVFHSKTLKTHILLSEAGCDYVSYQALLKFPPWDQAHAIVSY